MRIYTNKTNPATCLIYGVNKEFNPETNEMSINMWAKRPPQPGDLIDSRETFGVTFKIGEARVPPSGFVVKKVLDTRNNKGKFEAPRDNVLSLHEVLISPLTANEVRELGSKPKQAN